LRQERVARGEIFENENGEEAAVGVVEAVEEAMEKIHQHDVGNARERAARAALARFESTTTTSSSTTKDNANEEWRITTPTELDKDELYECIREGISSLECCPTTPDDDIIDQWVNDLVTHGSIHNWRELANVDPASLYDLLSKTTSTTTTMTKTSSQSILTEQMCDVWVDIAHSKSLDEIMLEILDGDQDVLEALREEAHAGTPRDLKLWSCLPDMLLEEAPSIKRIIGSGDDETLDARKKVEVWCARAKCVLEEFEWLEWYSTPVD